MPINILMPALSPTMTKGNLVRWLVAEGAPVNTGDVIAEIETDKATMEVETADEGVLGRIVIPDGTEGVAVNAVIGVLLGDGENIEDIEVPDAALAVPSPKPSPAAERAPKPRPQRT